MNMTTIMEFENTEVEQILKLKTVYGELKIGDYGIESCIDYYIDPETNEKLAPEVVANRLFNKLQAVNTLPKNIQSYSFEIPGCDRLRTQDNTFEKAVDHKVILSYTTTEVQAVK